MVVIITSDTLHNFISRLIQRATIASPSLHPKLFRLRHTPENISRMHKMLLFCGAASALLALTIISIHAEFHYRLQILSPPLSFSSDKTRGGIMRRRKKFPSEAGLGPRRRVRALVGGNK
jgi:hypothetical protein